VLWADQRPEQVNDQSQRNEADEKFHDSKPPAGERVQHARGEKDNGDS